MRHRHIEPFKQIEQFSDILEHPYVGIKEQRFFKGRVHQAIDLGPVMNGFEFDNRIEHFAQRDAKLPGVGEQGDRDLGHMTAYRSGGRFGAGDIFCARSDEDHTRFQQGLRRSVGCI